jgi:O-antigen ligase
MTFVATQDAPIARRPNASPIVATLLTPLLALVAFPVPLFLITLTVMLFRPPEIEFYSLDRIAFVILILAVLVRAIVRQQRLEVYPLTWPMFGLMTLAVVSAVSHPFEARIWSVTAAKFIVPFVLFHIAGLIFKDEGEFRWLERFSMIVLAYLTFTALAFWAGAHELVFPRFILNPDIGIHTERARGPFLQAVPNGVTLNLLGLLAIDRYRAGRLRGAWAFVLLASLPLAILATKTRSVWLSFAISAGWVLVGSAEFRRNMGLRWLVVALGGVALAVTLMGIPNALEERLQDSSPVEFRMAAYRAGWSMFLEKPLSGWGTSQLQTELAQRIDGFKGETFVVHNTYFEILLEHGLLGFALYLWVVIALLRAGRRNKSPCPYEFTGSLQRLWPLLVSVYLVNATFVVMNYQFVNGLLFAFAGILAAEQKRSSEMEEASANAY